MNSTAYEVVTPDLDPNLVTTNPDKAIRAKTQEIKKIIRKVAKALAQGACEGVVCFQPGDYVIHPDEAPIPVYPGITYLGYGARIIRSAMPNEPRLHPEVLAFLHNRFNVRRVPLKLSETNSLPPWTSRDVLADLDFLIKVILKEIDSRTTPPHDARVFNDLVGRDWKIVREWILIANKWHWTSEFASQDKGANTFSEEFDSRPTAVKGFLFDGKRDEQWAFRQGEFEHAAQLLLRGDPGTFENPLDGKLVVSIENCRFTNGVADGLSLSSNVKSTVNSCTSQDCYRGGLTITGGYAKHWVSDFIAEDGESVGFVQIEPEASIDRPVSMVLTDIETGYLDIHTKNNRGMNIHASRLKVHHQHSIWPQGNSDVHIIDSIFTHDGGAGKSFISRAKRLRFERCTFEIRGDHPASSVPAEDIHDPEIRDGLGVAHVMNCVSINRESVTGRYVEFVDCNFVCNDIALYSENRICGIHASGQETFIDRADLSVSKRIAPIIVQGGRMERYLDWGIFIPHGALMRIDGLRVDTHGSIFSAMDFNNPPHSDSFFVILEIRNLDVGNTPRYAEHRNFRFDKSYILHDGVVIDNDQNEIKSDGIWNENDISPETRGGRRICGVDSDPNAAMVCGYPGDIYTFRSTSSIPGEQTGGVWYCIDASQDPNTGRLLGVWRRSVSSESPI